MWKNSDNLGNAAWYAMLFGMGFVCGGVLAFVIR